MISSTQIHAIIDAAYAASLDDRCWPALAKELCNGLACQALHFFACDLSVAQKPRAVDHHASTKDEEHTLVQGERIQLVLQNARVLSTYDFLHPSAPEVNHNGDG